MYSDKKKSAWPKILLIVLLVLLAAGLMEYRNKPGQDMNQESALAIQSAVERSARQCYVVEGVYPESLEYLEEKYGLQVNTRDFYITYDAFASNLPPTVRVTPKQ